MEDLIIRNAIPDDAQSIATIHVKAWQCAYKGQIPDNYLNSLSIEQKTQSWREELENPKEKVHSFVADKNGTVLGWCTAGINRDEDVDKDTGELYGIYMHPDYINRGIGTTLMNFALNILKNEGYKKATLWVLSTNEKSRKFYKKKGWKIEGKTKIDKRDEFDLHEIRYTTNLQ